MFGKWNFLVLVLRKFLYFLKRNLFLYFRKRKPRKNFLYFLKRKLFLHSGNGNPEIFFYVSGNRSPEKIYYILGSKIPSSKNEKILLLKKFFIFRGNGTF